MTLTIIVHCFHFLFFPKFAIFTIYVYSQISKIFLFFLCKYVYLEVRLTYKFKRDEYQLQLSSLPEKIINLVHFSDFSLTTKRLNTLSELYNV